MICNDLGIALIKTYEGCKLEAYQDGNNIWTIGYGHTNGVHEGQTITQQEADDWLLQDLLNVERGVTRLAKRPLSSNQFSALCSLAYNIGLGNLAKSSAIQLINSGLFAQVPSAIMKWCHIGQEVSPGLMARRKAECVLWNKPDER